MPAPQIGDSSNNLLAKILQNLGGTPSVGDGKLNLLRKIAEAYGATTNRSDSSWMLLSKIVATGANKPSVSDSEYNLLYKFALNTGVSPFRGDGKYNILYRICQQTIPPVYDEDAVAFAEASGATDIANLSAFVTGVKDLGLWDSMVCWPLRSAQNAGTGTTAYSLGSLGTYNGTLVNGPTWGADGIDFSASTSQRKTDGYGLPSYPVSSIVIGRRVSGSGTSQWEYRDNTTNRSFARRLYSNNSMGLSIAGVGYIMLVNVNAQTLTDDFELATGIVPSATNSESEVFINTTKPAQTAGATTWGTGANSTGSFQLTGDLVFRASFHATFTAVIDNNVFYSLYKSTLGQGLGLP